MGSGEKREGVRIACLIQMFPTRASPKTGRVELQLTQINGHCHLKVNKFLFQAMNTLIC